MRSLLLAVADAGTKGLEDTHQRRKIRLLNYMIISGIFSFVTLLFLNIFKGSNPVFLYTNISGQLILYISLFFNHKGYHRFARWFCFSFLWIFFNSLAILLGKEAGVEFLNLLLCIAAPVFFDRRNEIFLIAAMSLTGFISSRITFGVMNPVLPNDNLEMIFSINMVILFVCSFLIIFFFRNEFQRYTGIIEEQHEELTEKNNEINSSLRYAQRIQNTLLSAGSGIHSIFPESFILHHPRDVVGGDFYWHRQHDGVHYVVCGDCTGHGVPGAFMCMIGISLLNEIINSSPGKDTGKILDQLNHSVMTILKQKQEEKTIRDGMEVMLLAYDERKNEICFSGANTSLFLLREKMLNEMKGDPQPIGLHFGDILPFTTTVFNPQKNDLLLLFTDGYADQFGGPLQKKMGYKRFRDLCREISSLPAGQRRDELKRYFDSWKGNLEQLDDICIVGLGF